MSELTADLTRGNIDNITLRPKIWLWQVYNGLPTKTG